MEGLTYKLASLEDYDDFYRIKCDPENVKWSGFASAPDYERMKEWFRLQVEGGVKEQFIWPIGWAKFVVSSTWISLMSKMQKK